MGIGKNTIKLNKYQKVLKTCVTDIDNLKTKLQDLQKSYKALTFNL